MPEQVIAPVPTVSDIASVSAVVVESGASVSGTVWSGALGESVWLHDAARSAARSGRLARAAMNIRLMKGNPSVSVSRCCAPGEGPAGGPAAAVAHRQREPDAQEHGARRASARAKVC